MAGVDRNVSAKTLAHIFTVSERRVQQLAVEGIVKKEARGRYNFIESLISYIQYLQALNAGTESGRESIYGDARTQKMRADADRSIMETAQLAGNLIPSDIIAYSWNHMIGAFRAKMLNLPKKTAPLVQHESTFRECQSIIAKAIHECLAELSDYQPPQKHFGNLEQFLSGSTSRLENQRVGGKASKVIKRKQRRAG